MEVLPPWVKLFPFVIWPLKVTGSQMNTWFCSRERRSTGQKQLISLPYKPLWGIRNGACFLPCAAYWTWGLLRVEPIVHQLTLHATVCVIQLSQGSKGNRRAAKSALPVLQLSLNFWVFLVPFQYISFFFFWQYARRQNINSNMVLPCCCSGGTFQPFSFSLLASVFVLDGILVQKHTKYVKTNTHSGPNNASTTKNVNPSWEGGPYWLQMHSQHFTI